MLLQLHLLNYLQVPLVDSQAASDLPQAGTTPQPPLQAAELLVMAGHERHCLLKNWAYTYCLQCLI
jgi:hypothetical protein